VKRAIFALLTICGCGEGVHGIADEASGIVSIEVRVDPDLERRIERAGPDLRAGVVWAAVPVVQGFCLSFGVNPLLPGRPVTSSVAKAGCRDPFDVLAGAVDVSVPFDLTTGTADVNLTALPGPNVVVGDELNAIAYGAVVVFDDVDGNGELTLSGECGNVVSEDRVYASSFSSLRREQERVVFREGGFDPPDLFYPAPECMGEPSPGLSIWALGTVFEDRCNSVGIDQHMEAAILPLEERTLATCRPPTNRQFLPPPDEAPPRRMVTECTDSETLAVTDPDCACPSVTVYRLAGCEFDFVCSSPEWDVRNNPPPWWPCGGGG